jgi:hypothetical protein
MHFVSIAFGLAVAVALPLNANAAQDAVLAQAPWSISPAVSTIRTQSWRAPLLSRVVDPSPVPSTTLANGFSHPLRYSIGTEWAVRAAVIALQVTGHATSGQRSTTGDSGQQDAVWPEPLMRPIDVRTGSSQTAL